MFKIAHEVSAGIELASSSEPNKGIPLGRAEAVHLIIWPEIASPHLRGPQSVRTVDRRLLSIDASGLFTAYSDSGLYHVIAEVPGLADTAMVTIAAAGQRRSWTEPVAKGAFFACKALGTFWRLNACGELLRDLKGLVTRRRRIGFDPTLLRFILVVLAVASAAALHTRRHPPDLSVLPPGWGRGRIQGPPQVAPS